MGNRSFVLITTFLIFLLAEVSVPSFANGINSDEVEQNDKKELRGKVVDGNGDPLIGATVRVKINGGDATITNMDGDFKLKAPNGEFSIEISYVGYKPKTVKVKDNRQLTITLDEDSNTLDEVVVIGYGTVRREALTGSVTSIGGKDIAQVPVTSVAEAMVGKLAGVQITSADGSPDADIIVRVRGGGSITQDNSPLYIVDGFPVDDLKDIAPTDIESIDILKDASSTAVYGARGANGVVNITTKRAKQGKASVSFNAYLSLRQLSKKLDVLDPYEYVLMQYEKARLSSSTPTSFIEKFGDPSEFYIYKGYKGDDWQDIIMGGTTATQYYNVTVNGSSTRNQYNLSLTHTNAPGILAGNGQKKTFLNFKMKSELFKFLSIEYNTRFVNTETDGAGTDAVRVLDALEYAPTQGLQEFMETPPVTGEFTPDEEDYVTKYNPLENTFQNWKEKGSTVFNTTAALNVKFTKNLTFRSEFGIDYNYGYQKRFYGPKNSNAEKYSDGLPYVELTKTETPKTRLANTLTYQFKIQKRHSLNVMLGQELNNSQVVTNFSSVRYLPMSITPEEAFDNMTLGEAYQTTSKKSTPERLSSFFGRVMYDYKHRIYGTFTMRADGSSKFAPGNRWGYFPAASAAWRISEEEFLKSTFVSNLKLRLSAGVSGNNRISSDLWKTTSALSTSKSPGWGETLNSYYTYGSSYLPNPDLKWEKTITNNIGVDFGFWNNRLSGTLDLYVNNTKDLLVPSTIPQTTGYSQQQTNVGETQNKGVELALNGLIVNNRDFTLSANFNIAFNKNKIVKLSSGVDEWQKASRWASTDQTPYEDYLVRVGDCVGLMYGYVNDGIYQVDDFDYNATTGKYTLKPGVVDCSSLVTVMPGAPKFKKLGTVDPDETNPQITTDDLTVIGRAMPTCSGGFGLNSTFKGFDLSIFFNYMIGNDVYNGNKMHLTAFWRNNVSTTGNLSTLVDSKHRFRYFDDDGNDLRTDPEALAEFNKNATMWNPTTIGSPIMMSYNVEDGSFLRLNTLTLGYTFPKRMVRKAGISNLRLYVTGYNLWLLTKYTGYDPEVNTMSGLTPGIDCNTYPRSRTYTFGVNLTF
jgi:TonB-linked SusC/RagA family outer membrane protein